MQNTIKHGLALNLLRTWANRTSDYDFWRSDNLPADRWLFLQRFLPHSMLQTVLQSDAGVPMPIYLHIERTTTDLDIYGGETSIDKHRSVAVDDWQLLPVLTGELTWMQDITHNGQTRSALCTYMYMPDEAELAELDLEDVITEQSTDAWQRLHVTVQLQGTAQQSGCLLSGLAYPIYKDV
jgi:hypothetical protein